MGPISSLMLVSPSISSTPLPLGVYVLVAPEPDRQQPHEDDEVYVVLELEAGRGVDGLVAALAGGEAASNPVELKEGQAVFVPAGADHRFVGYEQLSVLVIFAQPEMTV